MKRKWSDVMTRGGSKLIHQMLYFMFFSVWTSACLRDRRMRQGKKKNVVNKFMVYDGMENAFSHFSNAHKKWVSEHAGWNLMGWALSYYYHFNQKCIYANVMAFRETKIDLARTVCAWGWSDVHTTQSEMLSWDDSQTKRKYKRIA